MKKKILSYRYAWNLSDRVGSTQFQFENAGWQKWVIFKDKTEFQILITTLKNNSPLFFVKIDQGRVILTTSSESVGKENDITLQEFIEKL